MNNSQMLNYLLRTYDGLNKIITASKQRIKYVNPDADPAHQDEIVTMERLKYKVGRRIENELDLFPVWTEWLKNVPGIGPRIGGNLIAMFNFKHVPICAKCGADLDETFACTDCGQASKGDGILKTRIEQRDFPTISKWWKFMGVHIVDGKKPKRAAGVKCDWSSKGRAIAWLAADQFYGKHNEKHLYKALMLERIKEKEASKPDLKKGHRTAQAKHEVSKIFLAHFWTVSRHLSGQSVTLPYAGALLGHTNITQPFYYDGKIEYARISEAA